MKLEWVPDAVAPHVVRLAAAIGARAELAVKEAVDRAIAALTSTSPADPITLTLGPELAAMLTPPQPAPSPESTPENISPSAERTSTRPPAVADERPDTRRDKTAIAPVRTLRPTPEAVAAARARTARISARAEITRAPDRETTPSTAAQEHAKHENGLPVPRSSFVIAARRGETLESGGLGDVEEIDVR